MIPTTSASVERAGRPAADLVVRREEFGCLLYDGTRSRYLPYDRFFFEALMRSSTIRSDGKRELRGGSFSMTRRWLKRRLRKDGILADFPLSFTVVPDNGTPRLPNGALSFPLKIFLSLTAECGLECLHCSSPQGGPASPPLDVDEIRGLLDEAAERGCRQISLGGGEPLARGDLPEIVSCAKARGMWVSLSTNGQLLSGELASALRAAGLDFLSLSVDGALRKTYETIRAGASFDSVKKAARRLNEAGIDWAVHFTAMRLNLGEVERLPFLLEGLSCPNLLVTAVKPAGRARRRADLLLSAREMTGLYRTLFTVKRDHPWIRIMNARSLPLHRGFGCAAGNTKCGIGADGTVTPCAFHKELPTATIRGMKLSEIWFSHPSFGLLRRLKGNPRCLACREYNACRGGCRARAVFHGDGWNAPDPHCLRAS